MTSLSTFPRFSDLAIELRIQIWRQALPNRVIPIAINHQPAVTMHSCLPLSGSFCGQHSHCPSYNADSSQPSSSVVCMFNGYFSLPANTEDIEDSALRTLSLVCTESRSVVLLQYPETMTIYRKMWYPDVESHERRQVRCNPATDTLLVKAVPGYSSQQRHPSSSLNDPGDLYHEELKRWFPQNADIFASFRYILSSFRHVVFSFLTDFEMPGALFWGAFDSTLFRQFLPFFERLEHLYLCSDPENLTADREWERTKDSKDLLDISMGNMENLQSVVMASEGILNCDYSHLQVQRNLSPDSGDCCWVPMPKGFGGTWLFCPRDVFDKKW